MPVPMLADRYPFYVLDPGDLAISPFEAAAKEMVAKVARKVDVDELEPIDVVVCGSVAVNRQGARLGKGAGYSDIEVAILAEAGLVTTATTIVTTVHAMQVIDAPLPETEHDFSVDVIVTADEILYCPPRRRRPQRLTWEHLSPEKIAEIPLIAARVASEGFTGKRDREAN